MLNEIYIGKTVSYCGNNKSLEGLTGVIFLAINPNKTVIKINNSNGLIALNNSDFN